MTSAADQAVAFMRAAREKPRTLRDIAEEIGMTVDAAREILHRGVAAKRLKINDSNRLEIIIEVVG